MRAAEGQHRRWSAIGGALEESAVAVGWEGVRYYWWPGGIFSPASIANPTVFSGGVIGHWPAMP
jgi:hypothetical protein